MIEEPWYLSVEPRSPDEGELAVLRFLVGHDFPGAERLRADLDVIQVRPSCDCGCASIALIPPGVDPRVGAQSPAVPAPLRIAVLSQDGELSGGMILWVSNGHLSDLEMYAYEDAPALAMPAVRHLEVTVET